MNSDHCVVSIVGTVNLSMNTMVYFFCLFWVQNMWKFSSPLSASVLLDRRSTLQMVVFNNYNIDTLVNEFGIRVRAELAEVEARVLPPPMVIFYILFVLCMNVSLLNSPSICTFATNWFFGCCSLSTWVHKRLHGLGVGI